MIRACGGQIVLLAVLSCGRGGSLTEALLGFGHLGRVRVVDAQQHMQLLAAVRFREGIDFVGIGEAFAFEDRSERARRVIDFDLDTAIRMRDELAADHFFALWPVVPVVPGAVIAGETFAVLDELLERGLHRLGRVHAAGVVEENGIVIFQFLRRRDRRNSGSGSRRRRRSGGPSRRSVCSNTGSTHEGSHRCDRTRAAGAASLAPQAHGPARRRRFASYLRHLARARGVRRWAVYRALSPAGRRGRP